MIVKIVCKINLASNIRTHNIGSLLHGVIMEKLSSSTVDKLHEYRYSPLKQRLYFNGSTTIWEIVSLEEEVSMQLLNIFQDLNEFTIKHHNVNVEIFEKELTEIQLENFVSQIMQNTEPKKIIKINILSPTSFKSNGQYDIFPDIRKILRSIMLTFDYFSSTVKIYDYDTLDYLCTNVRIIDYSLSLTKFELEKTKIPSFRGNLVLKIGGNLQILQLINLIFAFGELSGVGIKTSMGMGSIKLRL